ncbi:MAG: hypothetical protein U5K32_00005, partial [Bacteroidales bacterium]|nr:hypothetical protein [Bacteroidales bacterium]
IYFTLFWYKTFVNQKRCLFLQPLSEIKRSLNTCDLRIFPGLLRGSSKRRGDLIKREGVGRKKPGRFSFFLFKGEKSSIFVAPCDRRKTIRIIGIGSKGKREKDILTF